MKQQSLKRQAAWITAVECAVRCLGFFQRLLVSRWLGAEAVGVMELASFAHMPALAPAASGLPGAVSRLTAKAPRPEDRLLILAAACLAGAACAAALYMAAPLIACTLYRLPEVAPLIRSLCPLAVVLPLQQVLTGLMGGLACKSKRWRIPCWARRRRCFSPSAGRRPWASWAQGTRPCWATASRFFAPRCAWAAGFSIPVPNSIYHDLTRGKGGTYDGSERNPDGSQPAGRLCR